MNDLVLESVLTCPHCGFAEQETMPTAACQFFYECRNCTTLLRVLLVRLGEVPFDSGTARMLLRLSGLIGAAAAILSVAPGCTWQQAYFVAQQWQRNPKRTSLQIPYAPTIVR